jgi:hypothetical protein
MTLSIKRNKYSNYRFQQGVFLGDDYANDCINRLYFQNGSFSDTLQYVDVPIVDRKTCLDQHSTTLKPGQICAGYISGRWDSCGVKWSIVVTLLTCLLLSLILFLYIHILWVVTICRLLNRYWYYRDHTSYSVK